MDQTITRLLSAAHARDLAGHIQLERDKARTERFNKRQRKTTLRLKIGDECAVFSPRCHKFNRGWHTGWTVVAEGERGVTYTVLHKDTQTSERVHVSRLLALPAETTELPSGREEGGSRPKAGALSLSQRRQQPSDKEDQEAKRQPLDDLSREERKKVEEQQRPNEGKNRTKRLPSAPPSDDETSDDIRSNVDRDHNPLYLKGNYDGYSMYTRLKPGRNQVEYEVERIVGRRTRQDGTREYLVEWARRFARPGQDNERTWEPEKNLAGCAKLKKAYDERVGRDKPAATQHRRRDQAVPARCSQRQKIIH
jgi:hypothetical protein